MAVASNVTLEYKENLEKRTIAGQAQDIWKRQEADLARSERMYADQFKANQGGQMVRNAIAQGTRTTRKVGRSKIARKLKLNKPIDYLAARVKVSAANTWIASWAIFWYLTFQLPIAVISAAGIGMAAAVYASLAALDPTENDKILTGVIDGATFIGGIGSAILKFALAKFGIDFDPIVFFLVPFILIFILGLFQLLLTWFIYSLLGIRSLSGKAGGVKGILFILVGVGYAIPILNLFPLIFLWMVVVWKYPR